MKRIANRSLALLMAVLICVSFLTVTQPYVHAANNWVKNWGVRGAAATELSDSAKAFYTGNDTYASLSQLSGGSSDDDAPSSALYSALQSLMSSKHTTVTGYDDTREMYQYTDCQNGGGAISSFYSGKAIGPDWDSGKTWNREHTWPNSKSDGGNKSETPRETDIMMLRPTSVSENSGRNNTAYGESSGYYDPNSESNNSYNLRGDVARTVLYVYVRWGGDTEYADGALEYMWGTSGVIESQEILLNWIEEDPVDTWEMGRNDSVESITGTRNVFVDYPELAFLLFGQQVPSTMSTPSNGKTPTVHTHTYGPGEVTAPTCKAQGYTTYACTDTTCDYSFKSDYTNKVGHDYANGICSVCDAPEPVIDTSKPATITFDDTSKRTEFTSEQQVWTENGVTVTNNKAASQSNVGDYANPARFYAGSELIIAYPDMTKIEVTCNASKYVTALVNSVSGATSDGNVVTITLSQAADTYTIASLNAQVRVNSITVYTEASQPSGCAHEWSNGICTKCGYVYNPILSTLPTAAATTYTPDLALSSLALSGGVVTDAEGETLSGTWSWSTPGTMLYAGTASYAVVFTPKDSSLTPISTEVEVTVSAADQLLTSNYSNSNEPCTHYAGDPLELKNTVTSDQNVQPVFVIIADEGEAYVEGTVLYSPEAGFVTVKAEYPAVDVNGDGIHEYNAGSVEIHTLFTTVPMYRLYDPIGGEHVYTGSREEVNNLVAAGWIEEGVAFNFPALGAPVYRLYDENGSGDHLYTMDEAEKDTLMAQGWNLEPVAFNSAGEDGVPQYRLYNPNAHADGMRGAWHFTSSTEERDFLVSLGWQYQGIGWYSTLK